MPHTGRDIHILRYFSSFISVSEGRIINVTDPVISHCPLASHLYKGIRAVDSVDKEALKSEIGRAIESKIRDFGLFTARRALTEYSAAIPYGASEMLMFALRKRAIDAAVVVCDGAGTVVTDRGEVVQGIGSRMNSLILTSPIRETIERLKELGASVVFDNALIDQAKGVEKAIKSGYGKIAVTLSGHDADRLKDIRSLESKTAAITILVVCTTGISDEKVGLIGRYADLVWSCASKEVRQMVGAAAKLQISKLIPVFALTRKGIAIVAAYAKDERPLWAMKSGRQYIISNERRGSRVTLGSTTAFLTEARP